MCLNKCAFTCCVITSDVTTMSGESDFDMFAKSHSVSYEGTRNEKVQHLNIGMKDLEKNI